jgi:hypothetical protein
VVDVHALASNCAFVLTLALALALLGLVFHKRAELAVCKVRWVDLAPLVLLGPRCLDLGGWLLGDGFQRSRPSAFDASLVGQPVADLELDRVIVVKSRP